MSEHVAQEYFGLKAAKFRTLIFVAATVGLPVLGREICHKALELQNASCFLSLTKLPCVLGTAAS